MARNAVAILSAVWLFLTPALCAAGVLTHACECAEGPSACDVGCEDAALGCDCIDDEGCTHDGCENDPCQASISVTTRREARGDAQFQPRKPPLLEAALATLLSRLAWDSALVDLDVPADASGPPGLQKDLPYHPSDTPLLV